MRHFSLYTYNFEIMSINFLYEKMSFELCKEYRCLLLKIRPHCIFYTYLEPREEMVNDGRILHLICRTTRETMGSPSRR